MRRWGSLLLFAGLWTGVSPKSEKGRQVPYAQRDTSAFCAPTPTPDTPLSLPPQKIIGKTPQRVREMLTAYRDLPYPEWARWMAQQWQGTPYGSGGKGVGPEELLLNLEQMDCMTAIENLLALHLARQRGDTSLAGFAQTLLAVRYQTTPPCVWEDRYHYLTHSFMSWEAWGSWLPIGIPDSRPVAYISHNRSKYAGFRDWKRIQRVEEQLSTRPRYYIPTEQLQAWLPALRNGDIIAFISTEVGLDVSHVGLFFWEGEKPTFAHASLTAKKWVYGEDLCAYLDRRRAKVCGITVFRPYP